MMFYVKLCVHSDHCAHIDTLTRISKRGHLLKGEHTYLIRAYDIRVGYSHMLALSSKGEVFSWGVGSFGQLGHGSAKEQMKLQAPTPLFVPAQPSFASTHAVAHGKPPLSGRGSIGANGKETIKKGGNAVKFARVFCGAFYSALLSRDGNVYTFGNGSYGKLGHGSASHSEASGGGMHVSTPQLVVSLANKPVSQIACGKRRMLCFMQTTLSALSLSTCPVVGGSDLLLTGYGVYDTGLQLQVQFTLCTRSSGGGNVTQRGSPVIVPGVFDSVSNGVRCKSPSFRALVQTLKDQFQCDDSNNSNINDNVNDNVYSADLQYIAYVSVSLDESPRFSNALPIHVFEDSAQYSQVCMCICACAYICACAFCNSNTNTQCMCVYIIFWFFRVKNRGRFSTR